MDERKRRQGVGDALRAGLAAFATMACAAGPALAGGNCAALPPPPLVIVVDNASRTTRTLDAERDLRAFALYAWRDIANDVIDGRGPYLDALADPFRGACADGNVLLDWLRRMLAGADSATEFSRRMGVALAMMREARNGR